VIDAELTDDEFEAGTAEPARGDSRIEQIEATLNP
jgi:hypothetical protein